jgi:hypothetical protein
MLMDPDIIEARGRARFDFRALGELLHGRGGLDRLNQKLTEMAGIK